MIASIGDVIVLKGEEEVEPGEDEALVAQEH